MASKEEKAAKVKAAKEQADQLKSMSLVDRRAAGLKAMLTGVNKKFGQNSIGFAAALSYKPVPRIPSGIFILDYALGGGWARGRVNVVWGDRSASKTTTMLRTIGNAQKLDVTTGKYIWMVREEHDFVRMGDPKMVERYLRESEEVTNVQDAEGAWARARLEPEFDEANPQHTDRLPKITKTAKDRCVDLLKLADVAAEAALTKAANEVVEAANAKLEAVNAKLKEGQEPTALTPLVEMPKRWPTAHKQAVAMLHEIMPMRVQFIDVEGALDFGWARKLGVDTDALIYSRPDSAEEAAEMIEASLSSAAVDAVVLDSLAAMIPQAEAEGEMADHHVGVAARINSKMLRKVQGAINRVYKETQGKVMPTLFLINQIRQKIGVMYGSPDVKPGGVAQDFYGSIEVKFSGNKVNYFDKDQQLPRASEFKFIVVKNKVSPPRIHGGYEMMLVDDAKEGGLFAGEIIEVKEVVQFAEQMGIYGGGPNDKGFRMYDDVLPTKREIYEKYVVDRERFAQLKRDVVAKLVPKQ